MATGHDLAQQLLRKAADDEEAARAMLPLESVADTIVGFHAQQAVEKSLKAVLAAREVEFPFTHDIGGLTDLCEQAGAPLPNEPGGDRSADAVRGQPAIRRRPAKHRYPRDRTELGDGSRDVDAEPDRERPFSETLT
jgi:HEPN domain-containing protein